MPKKYKIKISPDRTLGPLDMDRVEQLVMKGRIQGDEPTSADPFLEWAAFSSFPELSELLLKKLESDKAAASGVKKETVDQSTRTMLSSEPTKTMVGAEDDPPIDRNTGSFGIPTLVNLPAPGEVVDNPDLEKTRLDLPVPSEGGLPSDDSDGGTKILKRESVDLVLQQYSPPEPQVLEGEVEGKGKSRKFFGFGKPVDAEAYAAPGGKRRLLSRNTAALLALGIMLIAYWSNLKEVEEDPTNIVPRFHTFPYVEVNMPAPLGTQDAGLSATLTESGSKLIEKETPSAYMLAIKKYFYPAVGRNPKNFDARGLLASSYMRILEIIPRDEKTYKAIDKLLFPGPPNNQMTPEYVIAKSEYFQLLNRHDQAQEVVDSYMKIRPTQELLYQKAKIAHERGDSKLAITIISKAIPAENVKKANPRHLLFYATLLEKQGQHEASSQAVKRLLKESPQYGPGILYRAELLFKSGKNEEARNVLRYLVQRPFLLDRTQLAEAFILTAKVLEALNDFRRALVFANAAYNIHYDKEKALDFVFKIKVNGQKTKAVYSQIVSARQKEKARQTQLAENLYITAVEMNRSDPAPQLLLANLYEQNGNIYQAIDRYKKALDTPSRPIEAALNLARIYANRFQLEEAKNMINIAKDMRKNKDQVSYLMGLIHTKELRPDLADPMFERALRAGSRLPELYIQMGDIQSKKNEQKLAEFYYSMALRYDPLSPKGILGVALSRFFLDSPSRAISFLKDKLVAQPNSAAIMTNLAIIYLRSGDQDSGKSYLQNAIRSDSKYAEAFRLLGDLTKEEGDKQTDFADKKHSYRYALASYEMYSKLVPNDPEGYRATADLYFHIRDLGAAAKNYHKVLELTPNYPNVRLHLAQISRNGGDAAQALKHLEDEIKINPRNDAAYVEKGNIFMAKKDFNTATQAYTEAARLNENNADALFGLGVVYHLQGSFDNALSLFSRVIKLDPLKADVYWQMGLIFQKQNNVPKAIQAFTNYKGTVREPGGVARADEKLRELTNR